MKISVVIQTYNSELHLDQVLDAVKEFDEIVVCDMHSTDRTVEIAAKYNSRIVYHEHTGIVEPARNFAISSASHPWVLLVDSDEIVTAALREYLYKFIESDQRYSAINIPRKNYLLGRFMHAAYPDYIMRFFKRDAIYWPPEIHSTPRIDGEIFEIPRKYKELAFIHLENKSIRGNILKTNLYSDYEVERLKNKKYGKSALVFKPFWSFIHFYLLKGAYKDGMPGVVCAMQRAFYKYTIIAKILESGTGEKDYDKELLKYLRK